MAIVKSTIYQKPRNFENLWQIEVDSSGNSDENLRGLQCWRPFNKAKADGVDEAYGEIKAIES